MPEQTAPTKGAEETTEQAVTFEAITSQEALDKIVQSRIARERAKFADYDELKAKAAQFAAIEDAKKSDEQKWQERIEKLESELTGTRRDAEKARIQARYSISDEDAALFLTATDTEQLEAQAKALAERVTKQKKNGPTAPEQKGKPNEGGSDPLRELARQVFETN